MCFSNYMITWYSMDLTLVTPYLANVFRYLQDCNNPIADYWVSLHKETTACRVRVSSITCCWAVSPGVYRLEPGVTQVLSWRSGLLRARWWSSDPGWWADFGWVSRWWLNLIVKQSSDKLRLSSGGWFAKILWIIIIAAITIIVKTVVNHRNARITISVIIATTCIIIVDRSIIIWNLQQ